MRKVLIIIIATFTVAVGYLIISANTLVKKGTHHSAESSIVWDLYTDIFTNGGRIVYASGDPAFAERYIELANQIKKTLRMKNVSLIADTSVSQKDIENFSFLVLGTTKSNSFLNSLKKRLPVNLQEKTFTFSNNVYDKREDLVTFIIPNPLNTKKFILVHTGIDEEYVSQNLKFEILNDLIISRNHETMLTASITNNKNGDWLFDKNNIRNYESNFRIIKEDENFRYVLKTKDSGKSNIDEITLVNTAGLLKLKNFLGPNFKPVKVQINLYSNFEDKGLITLNTTLSHISSTNREVHLVSNDWINGNDFNSFTQLLVNEHLGKPESHFLQRGIGMYFSANWRGKGYKYWASLLYQSGNVPHLRDLLNEEKAKYESDFIVDPLSGAFIDFAVKKYGSDELISKYANWNPSETELKNIEPFWHEYLDELLVEFKEKIKHDKTKFNSEVPSFLKGFNFAHEGYDIHNGYLSRTAIESLKKLKSLNVNAIAVNPFTSIRDEKKREPLAFWRSPHTENDQSMIFLAHKSKELGLTMIMKPHIYLWKSWPGGIEMNSEEEWEKFYEDYYRWIRHYAILSEMYEIPVLCFGNELAKATLHNQDRWREIIQKLRMIYSGKLVYGANWGEEFENISFWDELDYIGISNYYPLSKIADPDDNDLYNGAVDVMNGIESVQKKFNKPVLFTEAGFRSSMFPWQSTFEDNKHKRDTNYSSQVRSYEAFYKAAFQRDWLSGIFWWKWPSYLDDGGDPHSDLYTPNFKPTEQVVKKWYGKNRN